MSSLKYNVKFNNDSIDIIKKTNFNINTDNDIIIINLAKKISSYYENVSSTANALATLIEYDISNYRCSRLFFNYNCESLNDAINNLINNGFCCYDDYNTDINDINEPPSSEIYNIAKEQKFTFDIIKLNKDLNSLFLSIINNEPFIISIRVYESFEYPETIDSGFIPMPKINETEIGGITILVIGFNKQQQIFIAKYQNKFISLPFFYLIKDNYSSDCYIFVLRNFNINIKTNKEEFKELKIDSNDLKIIESYIDLRSKFPEVYDQGKIGSCTANSLCSIFDYDSSNFKSSRLFLYYNERLINNETNIDEGASIRDGIYCLKNYGVCSEKDWAYNITNIFVKPSDICYENAKKNFVIEAFYISNDINTIKYWIHKNEPISLGINVYSNFMSASKTGFVNIPLKTDEYLGGHAVILCGFDDINKQFILRNSWGSHWGDNGYFYLPYDYITNDDLCGDLWIITKSKFEN